MCITYVDNTHTHTYRGCGTNKAAGVPAVEVMRALKRVRVCVCIMCILNMYVYYICR